MGTSSPREPTGVFGCGLGLPALITVLGASILLFVFFGGPLWSAPREDAHVWRILISYAAIVPMVIGALLIEGTFSLSRAIAASLVLGSIKLGITAPLFFAIAPGPVLRYQPRDPPVATKAPGPPSARARRYEPATGQFPASSVAGRIVRSGRPVAGALVAVDHPAPGAPAPAGRDVPVVIEMARYQDPSILAFPRDQLGLKNRDAALHTIHFREGEATRGNASLRGGAERTVAVPPSGFYCLRCDNHREETATLLVVDHPYAARTDADGRFRLDQVPAGEVTLLTCDPSESARASCSCPNNSRRVVVEPGQVAEVAIDLDARSFFVRPSTSIEGEVATR